MKYSDKKHLAIKIKDDKVIIKGKEVFLVANLERVAELQNALNNFQEGITTSKKNVLAHDMLNATICKTEDDVYAVLGATKMTLLDAVEHNYNQLALKLIESGAKTQVLNKLGFNLLHLAAKSGNIQLARELLERGFNVDSADYYNIGTPLMFAARSKNAKMVKLLLDYGANANFTSREGYTALRYLSALTNKPVNKHTAENMLEITDMLAKAHDCEKQNMKSAILFLETCENKLANDMLEVINKNIFYRDEEIRKNNEERDRIIQEMNELSGYKIN